MKASGPRVRLVTALDKVNEAQEQVNKDLLKMMWVQKTCGTTSSSRRICKRSRRRSPVSVCMFEIMTKQDLVAVAKELASHCVQDVLEEVLLKHRYVTLTKMTKLLTDKCTEAIKLNVKTENLRTESGVGQLGPSLLCLFFLDSAERHRRILRLSPLLLLSIITEHAS